MVSYFHLPQLVETVLFHVNSRLARVIVSIIVLYCALRCTQSYNVVDFSDVDDSCEPTPDSSNPHHYERSAKGGAKF